MAAQSNATQLFQSGTPSGITNVVRDANGMLTKWVENGFAMSVAWSSAGFPLQLVAAGPRGRLVQTYNFDANGRLAGLSGDNIPTEFSQELLLGVPATLASAGQVGALRSLVSEYGNRRVIIDTDWWTDVDDVIALRIAAWAERIGLWDIAAVMLSTTAANNPGSVDALLSYDGRTGVPIGVPATAYVPSGTPAYQSAMATGNTLWSAGYPASCVDAVTLYRRILADAENGVDIVQIGYNNNLAALMASPADSISPLTGYQLIAAKCNKLWCMGGNWPSGSENNFSRDATAIAAAAAVVNGWPGAITFLGYEVGATVLSGSSLVTVQATTDPVYTALLNYGNNTLNSGRSSWDPMMVLLAAIGDKTKAGYTSVSGTGAVNASTGANSWTSGAGKHEYVVKAYGDHYYASAINRICLPVAQQPTSPPYAPGSTAITRRLYMSRGDIGRAQPRVRKSYAGVLDANLVHWYHAADLADLTNGATVYMWPDRMGVAPLFQATAGNRPTYASAKNGRAAVEFSSASSQRITSVVNATLPSLVTVYVRSQFDTAPSSTAMLLAHETQAAYARSLHIKVPVGVSAQAVNFAAYSSGVTDDANAVSVGTGAWHVQTLVRTASTIEALYDAVGNGGTAITSADTVAAPLSVGGRVGGTEYMTGWISEIRIYAGAHDAATMAAVIADMV